jgi:hypothetical protein
MSPNAEKVSYRVFVCYRLLVQVPDEDVSHPTLAQISSFKHIIAELEQGTLSIVWLIKVKVGVPEGTTCNPIPTYKDRNDCSHSTSCLGLPR